MRRIAMMFPAWEASCHANALHRDGVPMLLIWLIYSRLVRNWLIGKSLFCTQLICTLLLEHVLSPYFRVLQGANDVANAMGPFAAVYNIWKTRSIPSKSNVPTWILVVGE